MFDRPTFSAGAVYIDPDVNISGTSPSGRSLKADNIAPTAWVPNDALCCHRLTTKFGWGRVLLPLTVVWQQSLMILMQAALSGVQLTLKP